ncbi:MAG: ECF-type sigma factor [Planctomycetota bacterium]|jgi:RNA polymerase sigma factor (TIGR02999 family)
MVEGPDRDAQGESCDGASVRSRIEALVESHHDSLYAIAERLFGREQPGHSLSPTALMNQALLDLLQQKGLEEADLLFLRACFARQCRNVLVDHARRRHAAKRGDGRRAVTLSTTAMIGRDQRASLVEIDDAIRRLAELQPRMARLAELRIFGEMTVEEAAATLEVSVRTAGKEWTYARRFLQRELE